MDQAVDANSLSANTINKILQKLNEKTIQKSNFLDIFRIDKSKEKGPRGLSTKKLVQLEEVMRKYLEQIEDRPTLEVAQKCMIQLMSSVTQQNAQISNNIDVLVEEINKTKNWLEKYYKKQNNSNLNEYEKLLEESYELKLGCSEIKFLLGKLKDFRFQQKNLYKLVYKLRKTNFTQRNIIRIVEDDDEAGEDLLSEEQKSSVAKSSVGKGTPIKTHFIKEEEIQQIIRQYRDIGVLLEEDENLLQEIEEKIEKGNQIRIKIQNALNNQNTEVELKQIIEEYESQNVYVDDILAIEYKDIYFLYGQLYESKDAKKAIFEEVDMFTLEEKIQRIKSLQNLAGASQRNDLLNELQNKLQVGSQLQDQFQKRLDQLIIINTEELQVIKYFINKAKTIGIQIQKPLINRALLIFKICNWVKDFYNLLAPNFGFEIQGNEDTEDSIQEKIEEYVNFLEDQVHEISNILTDKQIEELAQRIENFQIPDKRIEQIAANLLQVVWEKKAQYLLHNEEIEYEQLKKIQQSTPEKNKDNQIYSRILQMSNEANQWNKDVENFLNDIDKIISKQFRLMNDKNEQISQQAEEEIDFTQGKIISFLEDYNDNLSTIKEFKNKAQILQKYKDQINWYKESFACIKDIKNGNEHYVSSTYIKELVNQAIVLNIPKEWTPYSELQVIWTKVNDILTKIDFLTDLTEIKANTKKPTLQQAKVIFEELKIEKYCQLEDLEQQKSQIESSIITCEQWLENVITFTKNSVLTQEILEDQQNIEFLDQTISNLRNQIQELPYKVKQGEQILNDFDWQLKVKQLLLSKGGPTYSFDQLNEQLNYSKKNKNCDQKLASQLQDYMIQIQKLKDAVNRIRKNDTTQKVGSVSESQQLTRQKQIPLEELKVLASSVFSSKIKLENETQYLKELLQIAHKTLEALDNMMQQDPKPNIVDVQKMLDQLRGLPIQANDYENAIEDKIERAQMLANKLRKTYEVNSQTAEKLIKEYNDCNIFITDGFRLLKAYDEAENNIKSVFQQLELYSEEQPITYDDVVQFNQQADNKIYFDVKGQLTQLKATLFILRMQCINEYISNQDFETQDKNQIKKIMNIPYQVPTNVPIITFQNFKNLVKYCYILRKKLPGNNELLEAIKIIEQIAGQAEDFILDIYKIKIISKLEEIDTICTKFIDCSSIVREHKNCLLQNDKGYIPILESLIINDQDKLQELSDDTSPIFLLNKKPVISNKNQAQIENGKKLNETTKDKIKRPRTKVESKIEEEQEDVTDHIRKKFKYDEKQREERNQQKNVSKKEKEDTKLKLQQKLQILDSDGEETEILSKKQHSTLKKNGDETVLGFKDKQKKMEMRENESLKNRLKKVNQEQFNILEERRKFWEEIENNKQKDIKEQNKEQIKEKDRSNNVQKIKEYLEKCKYLKLANLDSLNIAKKFENESFQSFQKNKKHYDKVIEGIIQSLKNIRKMKYISILFMEEGYRLDYLKQFKDIELEDLLKQNDVIKENLIQKRLKSKGEINASTNFVSKRTQQLPLTDIILPNEAGKIRKKNTSVQLIEAPLTNQKMKNQFESSSVKSSRSQSLDEIPPNTKYSKKQQQAQIQKIFTEEITPEKNQKRKSANELEELMLAQNLEPVEEDEEGYKISKVIKQTLQPQLLQKQRQPTQVLKIYEGMMKFSQRSATKIHLLTSCNYYDLIKIPKLLYNDRTPLFAESSMNQDDFISFFEELLENQDREVIIISGWIQPTLDIYRSMLTKQAFDYLSLGIVGLTEYSENSTIFFLHKKQIKLEWKDSIDIATKRQDPYFDSLLCFFIVSKDYLYSDEFPKLQIEQFTGKLPKKKVSSRSTSPNKIILQQNQDGSNNIQDIFKQINQKISERQKTVVNQNKNEFNQWKEPQIKLGTNQNEEIVQKNQEVSLPQEPNLINESDFTQPKLQQNINNFKMTSFDDFQNPEDETNYQNQDPFQSKHNIQWNQTQQFQQFPSIQGTYNQQSNQSQKFEPQLRINTESIPNKQPVSILKKSPIGQFQGEQQNDNKNTLNQFQKGNIDLFQNFIDQPFQSTEPQQLEQNEYAFGKNPAYYNQNYQKKQVNFNQQNEQQQQQIIDLNKPLTAFSNTIQESPRFALSENAKKLEQTILNNPPLPKINLENTHKIKLGLQNTSNKSSLTNKVRSGFQNQVTTSFEQIMQPTYNPQIDRETPPVQLPKRRTDFYNPAMDNPHNRSRSPYQNQYTPNQDYQPIRDPYYRDYDYYERPYQQPPFRHPYDYEPRGPVSPIMSDSYRRGPSPIQERFEPQISHNVDFPPSEYERDMLYPRAVNERNPGYGNKGMPVERDFGGQNRMNRRDYPIINDGNDYDYDYDYPPPQRVTPMQQDQGRGRPNQNVSYRQPIDQDIRNRRNFNESSYRM